MAAKLPILLSFYALTNGNDSLVFGQLTYSRVNDLSFKAYSRRKTFRTLISLYRTRPYRNQQIKILFDGCEIVTSTNLYGGFYVKTSGLSKDAALKRIVLSNGYEVKIIEDLYPKTIQYVDSTHIVVSDIDDTLLHSFIYRKLIKFRTLMFTAVEKRRTVMNMQTLMLSFVRNGAVPIYLSNSEQNLYPLIYRFLFHNSFPQGPLFLKHMRSLWDVIRNAKFPLRNTHKINTLEEIIRLFPEKKFILMGDNTQHDLEIYLAVAEKFPEKIQDIFIRKVIHRSHEHAHLSESIEKLKSWNIRLHYAEDFQVKNY